MNGDLVSTIEVGDVNSIETGYPKKWTGAELIDYSSPFLVIISLKNNQFSR